MALVVGDVQVGNVQQRGLGAQHAASVAIDRHQGDFVQAVGARLVDIDRLLAQGVEVVAAWIDDPHLLNLILTKLVDWLGGVFVDPYLGKPRAGHRRFLAPAPDLGGIHVDEVGAAAHRPLIGQRADITNRWVVDQDGAVAVGHAADQRPPGVLVDVGADAVNVLG